METSFGELRRKETVNLCDGKRLGRVCDVVFTYPEGKVQGVVVPGGKGFRFGRGELFIELKNVKKIGVDVIFVELKTAPKPKKEKCENKWHGDDFPEERSCRPSSPPERRDYGEYE